MSFVSTLRTGREAMWSLWAAKPPAFRALQLPPRLCVPVPAEQFQSLSIGARVERGQRLTVSGPPALAPAAGRITALTQAILCNGHVVPAIEIETDDPQSPVEVTADTLHTDELRAIRDTLVNVGPASLPAWIDHIRNAAIWADRKASPDLMTQLTMALRRPIDTVLCNLLDSDPSARLLSAVAARFGNALIAGVGLLSRLVGAKASWIIAEAGAPNRWCNRVRRVGGLIGLEVIPVTNDYPQSDPSLLLYWLLDRRRRPGRPPVEQGALLLDAAAAVAIGQVVLHQQPMLHVPMALHDHLHRQVHFVLAPVGMRLADICRQLGGVHPETALCRAGDPLRNLQVPLQAVAGGGELVVHLAGHETPINPEPCIRCGWCVEGCPMRIQPAGLLEASQRHDLAMAEHYGLEACIECGICAYVCPSRLPLLDGIRKLRTRAPDDPPRS